MPVVAVIGAAAAWGLGGATAIGAVLGGSTAIGAIAGAVATVGATLGAVGAVTHDKTLSTVGMVMGGVGGLTALAANVGLIDGTASLFGSDPITAMGGDAASSLTAGDLTTTTADQIALPAADGMAGVNTGDLASFVNDTGEVADSQLEPMAALDNATQGAAGDASNLLNPAGNQNIVTAANNEPNINVTANDVAPPKINADGTTGAAASPSTISASDAASMGLPAKGSYIGQTATAPDGSNVTWTKEGWTKQSGGWLSSIFGSDLSPVAQYGAIKAAGSFLSGVFDPLNPAKVSLYDSQADANRAAASLDKQQLSNMQGKLPVAKRTASPVPGVPITGAPAPLYGGGLINNAPAVGGTA